MKIELTEQQRIAIQDSLRASSEADRVRAAELEEEARKLNATGQARVMYAELSTRFLTQAKGKALLADLIENADKVEVTA